MSYSWRSQFCPLATLAFILLMTPRELCADITGRISGVVTDSSGSVVPQVTIKVINTDTQVAQDVTSNSEGYYSFPALPVGHYDLEASHQGFKKYQQNGLVLDVNTALRVDITLEVGSVTEQVTVSAAAVQVETTSTQLGEVITSQKMTTVPLNGRTYTDLLALQPGVVPVSSGEYGGPGELSVSGQRESANGFMVNGANVQEGAFMATAVLPNLDSLAEFRILTSNFDAEYGNYSGGQVNAITKSGTNQYHGDLFDFLRNTDLDARNFFSPGRAKFIQNQFGGTIGGPILHDKLFFFGDYQDTRQFLGLDTGNIAVPSPADRSGNLADIADQLTGVVNGGYWASILSQRLGYPVSAGESYYTSGCVSNSSCVFPGAVIPTSAVSPAAQKLKQYVALPNNGPYYTTSAYNQNYTQHEGGIRLDFNSLRFGTLFGYYFLQDSATLSPYGSSFPGFSTSASSRSQLFNLGDTKTFGPTVVNEFHLNYTRYAQNNGKPQGGIGQKLSSFGIVEGSDTLGVYPNDPSIEGVPSIGFNNFSIGVPCCYNLQYNNTYQLIDNFTKVAGKHTIKFGGSVHYDQITKHDHGSNNGSWGFAGTETGSDWADFLIGAPANYTQGVQLPLHSRTHYIGLYGQDSWRVTPNLTLNYGLRWEVTSPWEEAQGQLETLVLGLQSRVFPGAPTGWVFPGDPGIPNTLAPIRYNNFAPRIGIAYAPSSQSGMLGRILGGPGKTSIRAGYGIFYTAFEDATSFVEVGDAPFGYFWSSPTPPMFETPFIDRATGNSERQRFPVAFPPPNVSAANPDNSIDWSFFLPISGSPAFATTNRVPYAEDYTLSIQRQIGTRSLFAIAYVGTQSHALLSSLESNPGDPARCLSVSQLSQVIPGGATCGPFAENGVYTTAAGQTINGTRHPFGNNFGSNQYFATIGNSNYNSLQTTFRHSSDRLEVLLGYTFSKSIDNGSGWQGQIVPTNYRLGRALSAFDLTHNFVASYHYTLPFDRFFSSNRLTSGWVLAGITRFASGLPVTINEPDDRSLLGTTSAGTVDRPNYTPGDLHIADPRTGSTYFNTSLFSQENLGQLGTSSQRFFHGPGILNTDIALLKDTRITESKTLQFRFEFFNVFNHAQFFNPDGNFLSPTFGQVTAARDPRIGQVALKFLF